MPGLLKYGKLMLSKYKQEEKEQHRTRVSTADAQHVVKLVNKPKLTDCWALSLKKFANVAQY